MLPKEAVKEYQTIYENVYGEKISYEEARDQSNRLVRLYSAVLKNTKFTSLDSLKSSQEYSSELRDNNN